MGSLNKRTEDLLNKFAEKDYNPLTSILAKYHTLNPSEQLKIDFKLLDYVYQAKGAKPLDRLD